MPFDPFIQSAVLTLEQLFSGQYRFNLPWVQRAYAWNELHVGRLIDDIHAASIGPRQRYSLGHMFIAKPGDAPDASLIDGHQRSITLTMLYALLRDLMPDDPLAIRLHSLIEADAGFHLTPQPSIAPFYREFVQTRALAEPEGDLLDRTENERNILANRDHMRAKIERLMPAIADRIAFALFLLERCYVILEIVEDEEEAWSLLSLEEETGLDLHSSERSKLSLVLEMPREEQEVAGRFYEQAQAIVGADDMSKLLGHIRMLKVRKRTTKPVEHDLKARFKLNASGLGFLEHELLPRAQTMVQLNRRTIGEGPARETTARALDTLSWVDHQFWMPAALHWIATMGAGHAETPHFFKRLDRLVYMMKFSGMDPTDQERHLLALLVDIDNQLPVESMPQLAIGPELLAEALAQLRSTTFYSKRFHGLVLRRICWNLEPGRDPGAVDGHSVTVEHVLPRKPPKDRRWRQDFKSNTTITNYCNRIGNLTFLSNSDNRKADTLDYIVKRDILRSASDQFALCGEAATYDVWTAEVIEARTEKLINLLLSQWDLKA